MSISPICTVNNLSTTNGVNVGANASQTISLASTAGVNQWSLTCVWTDASTTPAAVNATLVVNPTTKSATFTSGGAPSTLIFQSTVGINGLGVDANKTTQPSFTTTFGVMVPISGTALRVVAPNQTYEGSLTLGWTADLNNAITTAASASSAAASATTAAASATTAAASATTAAASATTAAASATTAAANATLYINVRTKGAAGDGATDDSAALLAAAASGAATIYFPPGFVCRTAQSVTFGANQTLYFDIGSGLKPDAGKTVTILGVHSSCIQARKDQYIFQGSGNYSLAFQEFEIKWFGAKGDGATDDTAAIQAAYNALMTSSSGGILYVHAGTYVISQTLTLIGDYTRTYTIQGDRGSGNQPQTIIKWSASAPSSVTMWQLWGVNQFHLRYIAMDGAGRNYQTGQPHRGSGPCMWFHTNQYPGGPSFSNVAVGAAANGLYFDDCYFTGVVGGLHAAIAFGDNSISPGSLTYIGGNYTLYAVGTTLGATITNTSASIACTQSYTAGTLVIFSNTVGTAGGQVVAGTPYYVLATGLSGAAFQVSSTPGGAAITFNASSSPGFFVTANGTYATAGVNAIGTYYATTLTSAVSAGGANTNSTFQLLDATGFTLYGGMLVLRPGGAPWLGHIITMGSTTQAAPTTTGPTTVTACDYNGNGGPGFPSGTTVLPYFPNAVATAIPAGTIIVPMNGAIINSEVACAYFSNCTWEYGGVDTTVPFWQASYAYVAGVGTVVRANPDNGYYFVCTGVGTGTSNSTQPTWNTTIGSVTTEATTGMTWVCQAFGSVNYIYAQIAVYSGYNTEDFGFERGNIFDAVFGFYGASTLNNAVYFHDVQFGATSAANIRLDNTFVFLQVTECGCESQTGWGYFINQSGNGWTLVDSTELVTQSYANPYSAIMLLGSAATVARTTMGNTLYSGNPTSNYGTYAQPPSIQTGGTLTLDGNHFGGEAYMPAVFSPQGYEFFNYYFGSTTNPNINRTHSVVNPVTLQQAGLVTNVHNVRSTNNTGTNASGSNIPLIDQQYSPVSYASLGIIDTSTGVPRSVLYKGQPRRLQSAYQIPYTSLSNNVSILIGGFQPRMILYEIIIENYLTGTWTGLTFSCATQSVSGGNFTLFSNVAAPASGNIITDGMSLPTALAAAAWTASGSPSFYITPNFSGSSSPGGSLYVYVEHKALTGYPN